MAEFLNKEGVGLMLQNINNHINTKLSNYLPKTTPIPDEVELIEISGDMLADEPIYTATEVQAIIDAYDAGKLIALHDSATRNYGNGWFIPSIFVRSLQTIRQLYISGVLGNFYIEQRFIYDTSSGSVQTAYIDRKLDLTDTKVTQTITSTNSTYPILFSATADKSTTSADAVRFNNNLKYNPSTDTLTVGNISSNIPGATDGGASLLGTCESTATSATKEIDIPGVNLIAGSRVWIYFSYGNSCLGNVDCTINHKGTQIEGAKISINGAVGGKFTGLPASLPGAQNSYYYSGIVFSSGYYEFIAEIINNVCYLRMTNNYIADSSPELHVKTNTTSSHNVSITLTPGVHTVFDNPGLTILYASTGPNRSYSFEFTSGSSAPTLTLPTDVKWANGTIPTWEANTTYHVSIVNNCAVCASFKTVS